jgi:ribosomal protein L31
MAKVFKITPKRIKRTNGTVLTPEMSITVTTNQHTSNPFYNGAKEIKEAYMRLFRFDYQKACCGVNDFEVEQLD